MTEPFSHQGFSLLLCVVTGLIIGALFDVFRGARTAFKGFNQLVFLQDIIFFIVSAFVFMYVVLNYNNGEIRLYQILYLCFGVLLYFIVLSKLLLLIFTSILRFIHFAVVKIYMIFSKPFIVVFNVSRLTTGKICSRLKEFKKIIKKV